MEGAWRVDRIARQKPESRPFPSSLGPLYQNEVKCSSFLMEMIFHPRGNKTHFHKKGFALGLMSFFVPGSGPLAASVYTSVAVWNDFIK